LDAAELSLPIKADGQGLMGVDRSRFVLERWRHLWERARGYAVYLRPPALTIDIKDLLGSIQAIRTPSARIGIPDDSTLVDIADPQRLFCCLDEALCAFRDLRGGADYLVSAEVNTYNRAVWIRFVQAGPCQNRGQVEPALDPSFHALRAAIGTSRGKLDYWGGNNYFDISLPFRGPMRESFPEVKHLPWNERYRNLLDRATWESLRGMVFRFSNLAETFAARCGECGASRILIPSVGLCVHPWLFADHGLSVVATDAARTALDVLAEPERWPRLYSRAAFERWDIAESARFATQGNPDHFEWMPDLGDRAVRESLGQRVTFFPSDWGDLPLEARSVDAIFATNALPRESSAERLQVLNEWARVIRPGGLAFIAQHNFVESDVESILFAAGWIEADILGSGRPAQSCVTRFQMYHSSG
jgi:SAM-dependent methyltransferase